jgi:DinB superfamily
MSQEEPPLTSRQAAALLAASAAELNAEVSALPAALLRWKPGPDEWCALEVIGHLIETEKRGFAGRIRTILAEPGVRLSGWDPDAVARERRDAERVPSELLAEFTRGRAESVALVETLTTDDLNTGGDHPEVGFLRVSDLLHEWVHHDRNHVRQLFAIVQDYTWPNMGNARRFSQPEIAPLRFDG